MFKSLKTGKVKGEGLLCKGSCEGPGISWSNCQHLPHCYPHPSTVSLDWWILCFVEEIVKEAEVFLCLCFVGPEISCPIVNRIFHVTMVLHSLCHLAERGFTLLKKLWRKQGSFSRNFCAEEFVDELWGWEVYQGIFGLRSLSRNFWADKFVEDFLGW